MYGNQVGGTLAAAVLGVGTTAAATNEAPVATVKLTASQVGRELARTGTSLTVELAVLAAVLFVAGLLLVSLARRHDPARLRRPDFGTPQLT